jgi:hypothetical protein
MGYENVVVIHCIQICPNTSPGAICVLIWGFLALCAFDGNPFCLKRYSLWLERQIVTAQHVMGVNKRFGSVVHYPVFAMLGYPPKKNSVGHETFPLIRGKYLVSPTGCIQAHIPVSTPLYAFEAATAKTVVFALAARRRPLVGCPAVSWHKIVAVAQVAGSRPQPPFHSTKRLGNIVVKRPVFFV